MVLPAHSSSPSHSSVITDCTCSDGYLPTPRYAMSGTDTGAHIAFKLYAAVSSYHPLCDVRCLLSTCRCIPEHLTWYVSTVLLCGVRKAAQVAPRYIPTKLLRDAGTGIAYGASCLRAGYAMSGTDTAYGADTWCPVQARAAFLRACSLTY
eukprot:377605-Rhodomonas_salina.5